MRPPAVEAQVRPVGRGPRRHQRAATIGQAERDTPFGQERSERIRVPRWMAGLDGDTDRARKRLERPREPVDVGWHVGGQLEQDRSQVRSELARPLHEVGDGFARLVQAPDVGQVSAGLDRKGEVRRDPSRPGSERRTRRHPVEGHIQLDRVETLGEELQLRTASVARVEAATPVLVQEPGGSEIQSRGRPPGSLRGCSTPPWPTPCASPSAPRARPARHDRRPGEPSGTSRLPLRRCGARRSPSSPAPSLPMSRR